MLLQETMFQRSLPDYIRGRISTIDRGAEIVVFSVSSFLAGFSLLPHLPSNADGAVRGFFGEFGDLVVFEDAQRRI